ncbi:interleukin-7 receptor subunit alpha [Dendropsophus ebraccatus]|uniref:interleukin-7 receptor subunit alpha n=1 Tax=Dendropsophus ebraccatus TaxID=150705 RepID=UPI0038311B32
MHVSSLTLLFLLLHSSRQQSGDPPEAEDDEELDTEMQPDFDCFSKLRINKILLLCNITKFPPGKANNVKFTVQYSYGKLRKWSKNRIVEFQPLIITAYNVCMDWRRTPYCKTIKGEKIVIPDSPHNVTITYNSSLKEYVFNISVPYGSEEYLNERLKHELVLRKEGTPWLDCNETLNFKSHKMVSIEIAWGSCCFENLKDNFGVPKTNLEYSTNYEARVRSIPTGGFYDGSWSPWSAVTTFQTENGTVNEAEYVAISIPLALSISISFFLVTSVILIAVFWKSRIKPLVWPEIPDHKKTLEKFINKPKQNLHISFNPDYSEILPINIIDYIKAQEILEDNHEISTPDGLMEKLSLNTFSTTPPPPEGSRGHNTNTTGQCKSLSDDGENTIENPITSGTVKLIPGDGVSEKCNGTNGITSVDVKHPGAGLKGLCWEDIYIAMSAFKTPNSAVKQVPKNNF